MSAPLVAKDSLLLMFLRKVLSSARLGKCCLRGEGSRA